MTALRFATVWLSPALLLGVAGQLYAGAPGGLVLALLVALVPCLALVGPGAGGGHEPDLFAVVLMVLAAILVLTANLIVIGDVATSAGAPRWHGVVVAAGCAFALTIVPVADRLWPWLVPGALAHVILVLGAVAVLSGAGPVTAWTGAASRADARFVETSPWVVSGGTFPTPGSLSFTEVQTVTALRGDVFRVVVSDIPVVVVHEWRPDPGDAITLRPGDRLAYEAGARLRFGAGTRIPGAPRSGPAWADMAARRPVPVQLGEAVGLALTLGLGGSVLLRPWVSLRRAGAALALALVTVGLWLAAAWAVYAAWLAPDLFLGDARAASLIQLPQFALDAPWGRRLTGVLIAGLIALFVATASALRSRIGALDRSGGELGRDVLLWAGMFGVAGVASLWPSDPWAMLLLAFGLLGSTLGAAALPGHRASPRTRTLASALALAAFGLLALAASVVGGSWLQTVTTYPALVAAPLGWVVLRLAGPRPA